MVDIDKAIIARYKHDGKEFEILVDCDKALELREGKEINIEDVLATRDIYSDTRAAKHASENDIREVFETNDPLKVAEIIIKKGEIQLTAEHKRRLKDEKTKQIVYLIHKNAINPQTDTPHPPQRIENAMDEAKVKVDEFLPAEKQMQDVVKKISSILPIKIETREISIRVPAEFAGKAYAPLKQFGRYLRDQWDNDGSLVLHIEIPAGLQEELTNTVNKLTQGQAEITIEKKI
ncbi:MAG: ribosome assembly factor SBDS [archaeon]